MSIAVAKNRVAQAERALASALRTLEEAEAQERKRKLRVRHTQEARQLVNEIGYENMFEWYRCGRKTVYITESLAILGQTDPTLASYICVYCTGWHNGHGNGTGNPRKSSIINALANHFQKNKEFA